MSTTRAPGDTAAEGTMTCSSRASKSTGWPPTRTAWTLSAGCAKSKISEPASASVNDAVTLPVIGSARAAGITNRRS